MFNQLGEAWLPIYIALAFAFGIMVIWSVRLIRASHFLDIKEPPILNVVRRVALVLMGVGVLFALRWHVENNRPPWPSEVMLIVGLDLYLAIAICSTYYRMKTGAQGSETRRLKSLNRIPSALR